MLPFSTSSTALLSALSCLLFRSTQNSIAMYAARTTRAPMPRQSPAMAAGERADGVGAVGDTEGAIGVADENVVVG
ncbi:uncharacterized protein M421DRAFT_423725 [Didymella exigua CBS 183.55]|uniref:Secreted protein n=1 Tax=Didymella exigua CBS 183.55 TaxID=1150837 RepID=A0A6A5RDD0_9PLEO|nr:uncharacterized protein M421DRAFT_423725 [Didymella exigua CBS 183.55]KAF1925399.1 hypothetical protein M421DRAFT_423725 [Didymella exigua CBS 183.55]